MKHIGRRYNNLKLVLVLATTAALFINIAWSFLHIACRFLIVVKDFDKKRVSDGLCTSLVFLLVAGFWTQSIEPNQSRAFLKEIQAY